MRNTSVIRICSSHWTRLAAKIIVSLAVASESRCLAALKNVWRADDPGVRWSTHAPWDVSSAGLRHGSFRGCSRRSWWELEKKCANDQWLMWYYRELHKKPQPLGLYYLQPHITLSPWACTTTQHNPQHLDLHYLQPHITISPWTYTTSSPT